MSRERIISDLYNSKDIDELIKKFEPSHLHDELKQELFLVICELPESDLIQMFENKTLGYYCVRLVINMISSNTSGFYRKFRRPVIEFNACFEVPDIKERHGDHAARAAMKQLERLETTGSSEDYYYANIWKAYVENDCSSIKLSKASNIPERTIRMVVRETRKYLRQRIQKHLE